MNPYFKAGFEKSASRGKLMRLLLGKKKTKRVLDLPAVPKGVKTNVNKYTPLRTQQDYLRMKRLGF